MLQDAGRKVNARKSLFGGHALEYLRYCVAIDNIQLLPKKGEAIVNLEAPTAVKQVRKFIGMVSFYRDMWRKRSDVLAPLTRLTKKENLFGQKLSKTLLMTSNAFISSETLLAYLYFSMPLVIHTDVSKTQLDAVILQKGKHIAKCSRNLNDAQKRYTTTEQELPSIVEAL